MKTTVLVVDDEPLVRRSLKEFLSGRGYEVREAETGALALERFREGVDAVLLDFNLPDLDGIEVLAAMRALDPTPPVVMLTAHSSVERAVKAMQAGATHFAAKPFDLEDISALLERSLEPLRLRREVARLRREAAQDEVLVGESPRMLRVRELLERIARSPGSTVLIAGESGTGKDLAARLIHARSERRAAPFVNITCSALPDALLESELFGHERGAFTDARQRKAGLLEEADGGTVFLDEIAEMSPQVQAKLLRFLEAKTFRRVGGSTELRPDVRVIAATHKDLVKELEAGRFREDLYYRLAVLQLELPALRERDGDVELLAQVFVERFNREFHRQLMLSPDALRLLRAHRWPGNVRELRNALERAVLLAAGPRLETRDLDFLAPSAPPSSQILLPPGGLNLEELERRLIGEALERAGGNQSQAARLLGLTRDQIRYRMGKFELTRANRGAP
ncbi:MAG: sigma-54-dependent transcriptional regulator [Planctomycetota bacterium]